MAAEDSGPRARVEVLGPLRLLVDGRPVDVRGTKRRAVLALLAIAGGRVVTVDQLLDALWQDDLPEFARQSLHSQVSRLRGNLGTASGRLQTHPDGYLLDLATDELDLRQARTLLAAARGDVKRDPMAAVARLERALELWRGPVLADLVEVQPIAATVESCVHLRREVIDTYISAALAAGNADRVERLAAEGVADEPLREPGVLLQMRVLAAMGRPPEALTTGREFRHRLAEETGLDPSPALGELEREIAGGAVGAPATRPAVTAALATRLIGRDADVAALQRLLGVERLVTLVGAGGVGKTRVALEVARRAESATTLLLARVTEPAAIPHALAAALNLSVAHGDVLAACAALIGDRPSLLVIDNCEHLLDAAGAAVEVLLAGCPQLSILATSREPLGLAAECVSRLAPLPLPDDEQDLPRVPSVAVFLDRAARVRAGPPPTREELRTIADIVRQLDGVPLAIELAAGRLSTFSLSDLHGRLDRSLDLLGGRPTGEARHRTLRATVEWSYRLLSDDEQRLFRHLSVFVDGVSLDAAERLAAELGIDSDPGSALARLVDASMLGAHFEGGTRYRMLETLRAYGLDRLRAAGEERAATERMLGWAAELSTWTGQVLASDNEPEADAMLRRELPNLRAAWRLARDRGSLDVATAMVAGLFEAVAYRDLVEIRDWAKELAEDPALAAHPRAISVLGVAAEAAYHSGDYLRAEQLTRSGLELAPGAADSWLCLLPLSVVELARGVYAEVVEHCLAAVALCGAGREAYGIAALATAYGGDPDGARELNDRGLAAAVSPSMRAWGAYVTGEIETCAGHRERAEPHYVRSVELAQLSGATFLVGVASVGLLAARAEAGRVGEALRGYGEVVDYFAKTGNWTHLWVTLRNLADLLRRIGDAEAAAVIHAAAAQAPDAPVAGPGHEAAGSPPAATAGVPSRSDVLELARRAVARQLA
jgi:predicted ATPase/DNA-binding SARP family transcriptional activator